MAVFLILAKSVAQSDRGKRSLTLRRAVYKTLDY